MLNLKQEKNKMIKVFPLKLEQYETYQNVFNNKNVISHLGGFTHRDTIKSKIRQSGVTIWGATYYDKPAGAVMIAGRNQCHFAKFGEVGVLEPYRRNRIMTALYSAIVFQGILEGRRLWEDTIVGNNPFQFDTLPTLNIRQVGLLPQKTASFLDIYIFALELHMKTVSLLLERLKPPTIIHIVEDYYTRDIFKKNMTIYEKKNPEFMKVIQKCYNQLSHSDSIVIDQGLVRPVHNAGKPYNIKQETIL